jgi:ribosome-binding factor A
METIRQKQMGELVKRNFSIVLQEEGVYVFGAAPLVTVTSVKVTPDLNLAKIYLSIFNTENKQAVILEMDEHKQRLRQGLAHRLRKQVRRIPDIDFYLDDTLDEMFRMEALFQKLHQENQMGSSEEE